MRRYILILFLLVASTLGWSQATCLNTDVQNAINGAATNATVTVPAGSCTWTNISITKGLTLQGAGVGATNITLSGNPAVTLTKTATGIIVLKGFSFSVSSTGTANQPFLVNGAWKSTRPVIIRNNAFNTNNSGLFRFVVAGGVIVAQNSFVGLWDDSFLQIKDPSDTSNSWGNADTLGTRDQAATLSGTIAGTSGELNFYIEDNTFNGGTNQGIDCDDACRMVNRHNAYLDSSSNSHGFDTSSWGIRHFEIYSNTFRNTCSESGGNPGVCNVNGIATVNNINQFIWIRGATGVIFSNQMENNSNSWWGNKPEVRLNERAVSQPTLIGKTCANITYPVTRGLGRNYNGTSEFTDPIYIWSNTVLVNGSSGSTWAVPEVDSDGGPWDNGIPDCSPPLNWSTFFQWGRDAINQAILGGSPKPSYTAFAYPHPLVTTGVPAATLSPSSQAFGSVDIGTSSPTPTVFTLSNSGSANLTINSIGFTGTNPGDWKQTNNCGIAVGAGGSCSITVYFSPTVAGSRAATLSVVDNATGSPHTASLTGTGTVCTAPNPYPCARTDSGIIPLPTSIPSVGGLTGAGTVITDPDFGERILRVTDSSVNNANFLASNGGGDFDVYWNQDDTRFAVTRNGGVHYVYSFNPTTFTATRLYGTFSFGGDMEFSTGTQNLIYVLNNLTIGTYDVSSTSGTPVLNTLVNMGTVSTNCLPPGYVQTWNSFAGPSRDDQLVVAAFASSGGQNDGTDLVAWHKTKGCMHVDTGTGAVVADLGWSGGAGLTCGVSQCTGTITTSDRIGIHSTTNNYDGSIIQVDFGKCISPGPGLCGDNGSPYYWVVGTTTLEPLCQTRCGGHPAMGQNKWINRPGTPAGTWYMRTIGVDASQQLNTAPGNYSTQSPQAMHEAWKDDNITDTNPAIITHMYYHGTGSCCIAPTNPPAGPWWNEIMAIQTNAAPNAATVWRFGRMYNSGDSPFFTAQQGIGVVSQTGKYMLFTSDWLGALGSTAGAASCTVATNCRADVFLMDLRKFTATVVTPTTMKGKGTWKGNVKTR